MSIGVAAECARRRLTVSGSASTKRFHFLIMHRRRDSAKSVSKSTSDLNKRMSKDLTLESMTDSGAPLLALACFA